MGAPKHLTPFGVVFGAGIFAEKKLSYIAGTNTSSVWKPIFIWRNSRGTAMIFPSFRSK